MLNGPDHHLGWWIRLPSSTMRFVEQSGKIQKTFRVSATGCIRTVYNPFDGILVWNQTRNLTSIREPPRLEFGEDEFSINFNIKDSFSFRHQLNITDLHFLQFCRDTLRIRKVVSHGTVDDFCFHDFTLFIGWIADYSLINRSPYTFFSSLG